MMAIVAPVSQSDVSPGSPVQAGHDTPGGSQGAASSGRVWAAQPRQGRHQETRHSTPLRCSLCGPGRLYFYVNCSLHPIHLKTYSAHNLWSSFLSCHIPFQLHKPDLVKKSSDFYFFQDSHV